MAPNDVGTLATRGYLYRKLGEFKLAVDDYSSALRLAPSQVSPPPTPSSRPLACLCSLRGTTGGRVLFSHFPGLSPPPDTCSQVRLHNNRGYCLAKLGRYTEAVEDYNAVRTCLRSPPLTTLPSICLTSSIGNGSSEPLRSAATCAGPEGRAAQHVCSAQPGNQPGPAA